MKLSLLFQTARCVTVEIDTQDIFFTKAEYSIYLNGECIGNDNKVIRSIYDLLPDTKYELKVVMGKEEEVIEFTTEKEFVTLNVKDFGAKGDGEHDDTIFIQAAIMAVPADGRVYIPEGTYRFTSLFLKSNLKIEIAKGATLLAFTEREKFPVYKGLIDGTVEDTEYNLGSWEGNPDDMFTALICGTNCENVVIYGEGIIDGNGDFDNWWHDVKNIIIAARPRLFFINKCENVILQGITVQNSPSWTLHPYFSNNLKFIDLFVNAHKYSPNTDGLDPESCKNVDVVGVHFTVGDDCIAIKSGKMRMGKRYKVPTSNMTVRQCYMQDGHGAVTLGSEMAAGIKDVYVKDCIFSHTDRGLRIKTRRGRGEDAVIDNVFFENIIMDNVRSPFTTNSYYNCCDPDCHSEYVRSKDFHPVDDRTPLIKKMEFRNIKADNAHVSGMFFYGLPEQKIEEIVIENVDINYAEDAEHGMPVMMDDFEPVSKMGIFANNIKKITIKNVKIEGQIGDKFIIDNVDEIDTDIEELKSK
jgi:Endopolygalacturonase